MKNGHSHFSPQGAHSQTPKKTSWEIKCPIPILIPTQKKKLVLLNLFLKLSQHPVFQKKNPRLDHFENIIRQHQGRKNQIPLQDLEFYQEQILAQIPREEITRKKVREFVKKSKWKKVRGNDHEIFNHITGNEGNDYEHLLPFLIDDFKFFSLCFNDLQSSAAPHHSRKKFLNYHQVLFALLKKNGFNPNEDDFKLLILPSRRAEQEKVIQEIFKKNNWEENGTISNYLL